MVLRKGADGAKLVCTTPIITSSESTPAAAAAAGRIASLRAMEMKRPKRLMEMERFGRPKRLMEMDSKPMVLRREWIPTVVLMECL